MSTVTHRFGWTARFLALAVALLAVPVAGRQAASPSQAATPGSALRSFDEFKQILALPLDALPAPSLSDTDPPAGLEPLPEPSIHQPFEIGEALYDPARVPDAVVSLLAAMGIGVIPDGGSNGTTGGTGLKLDATEVRTLIAMTQDDLAQAPDIDNLAFTFADVHRAVSDLVPGMSVEDLAAAYSRAYDARPNDLVPRVLMGQPILPETHLTRVQVWLLLMDGFAGAQSGTVPWGTADRVLPDVASPNPQWTTGEWREVLARLPLLAGANLVASGAPTVIRQGAGPQTLTARLNPQVPPLVSRTSGKTLIPSKTGSLAGGSLTWQVADDSILGDIGTFGASIDEPQPVGADGIARLPYRASPAPTGGRGLPMEEWVSVGARVDAADTLSRAYDIPAALSRLALGSATSTMRVRVRWLATDALHLSLGNVYEKIRVTLPLFGRGTRNGFDSAMGWVTLRADGTYRGALRAHAEASQALPAPACVTSHIDQEQTLYAIGRPVDGIGAAHTRTNYAWIESLKETKTWADEPPDGGYFAFEFFPMAAPKPSEDTCQPFIRTVGDQNRYGSSLFLAVNDARWTTPLTGFVVGLRRSGDTFFVERTLARTPASIPRFGPEVAKDDITGPLAAISFGRSEWAVLVRRRLQ
jgi:hypothetical protein